MSVYLNKGVTMFKINETSWYKVSDRSDTTKFGKVVEIKDYRDIEGPYIVATIKFEDNSLAFLKERR